MQDRRRFRRFAAASAVVALTAQAVVALAAAQAAVARDTRRPTLPSRVRAVTVEAPVHVASLPGAVGDAAPMSLHAPMPIPRVPVPTGERAAPVPSMYAQSSAAPDAPGAPIVASSFAGAPDNGWVPPDVSGAAGPSHLVTTLNGTFRVQTRTGATLTDTTLAAFWSGVASSPFDPRVVYDPSSGRWFTVAVSDAWAATSKIVIAASAGADPTGAWHRYSIVADPAGIEWADFPTIGIGSAQVVVQSNMFRVTDGVFASSLVHVFSKTALTSGASISAVETDLVGYGGTQQPSVAYGPGGGAVYLLQESNGNSGGNGFIRLYEITPAGGVTVRNLIGVADPWAFQGNGRNDFAPQKGSAALIQTNDARMGNVVWRAGKLYAAHTVFLPPAAPTRSSIQWWIIDAATGGMLQRGRIDDPSGAVFGAFPSVGVNANEDMLIGHARFSHLEYASAGYAFRYGSDAANTIRSGGILKAGLASYYKTKGSNPARNRWGDYTATIVDPVDESALWTLQMYAATPSGGTDKWATWWGRLVPNPGPASAVTPSTVAFGSVPLNTPSTVRTVTLTNAGSAPLQVGTTSIAGGSDFARTADACSGVTLNPGAQCTVGVVFTPTVQGARSATLSIPSDSPTSPDTVALSGTGYAEPPRISVEPGSIDFGGIAAGATSPPRTVTIRNIGSGSLTVTATRVTGAADFTTTGSCTGPLASGASCAMAVAFRPAGLGMRTATLEVDSSLGRNTVGLAGVGLDVVAPRTEITTPSGSVAIGSLMPVRGGATDDLSGLERVTVTFRPLLGSPQTAVASLVCNTPRTSCSWAVAAPAVPGIYTATSSGRDRSGNVEANGPSITIFAL